MGSTLKGKDLVLKEQVLSFKSCPLLKREVKIVEWLPLQVCVYPFTFIKLITVFGSDQFTKALSITPLLCLWGIKYD